MPKSMPKKEKILNHRIVLSLDFGASLTKGVFQDQLNKKPHVLNMDPEIALLTPESVAHYVKNRMGESNPEDCAWVGCDGQFRAVGFLATRFSGNSGLKQLKHERAVHKTLAAIWVATQKLGIKNISEIEVFLSVLLPSSEYGDKNRFESSLKQAMQNFLSPSGEIFAKLAAFNCKPEGTGVYLGFRKQSQEDLKSLIVSVVMIGYRNASILSCLKGELTPGVTSDLGFVRLVEAVQAKTSGLDEKMAIASLALAGVHIDTVFLVRLCRSTTEAGRAEDLRMLTTAIKDSRRSYFQNVQSWLDSTMHPKTDVLIFSGGTSEYFRQCFDLAGYYKLRGVRVFWHTDWEFSFESLPKLARIDEMSRYFDVYCFFMYFLNSYLPRERNS